VKVVYSPLDAVRLAQQRPQDQVVFFAVGFETTAPATALAMHQARALGLDNFSLMVAHVRVPPAVEVLLAAPERRIEGLLAAGHVCTVMGLREYAPLVARFGVPIVATGFDPLDILEGGWRARSLSSKRATRDWKTLTAAPSARRDRPLRGS